jgi:hypothetical protein
MIKRIGLVVLALLLLLFSSPVKAESDISVLDKSVTIDFPYSLAFNLEAESSANIVDARLHYQVDKMNYAQVVSEGWAEFTPATRIETSWVWDMRRASLPPGAQVTYWWTIKNADGDERETLPAVVRFDDGRYQWQNLTSGNITLFWYEGDNSFAWELMNACQEGLTRLTQEFGAYPERHINIYVYASSQELRGAMIFPQEWTGGVAFTEFGIIAIGISLDNIDWGKEALVHELTHLVVHQIVFSPYGALPVWLDEGLAMYNQGELSPQLRYRLKEAISEDNLLSVRSLCSPFSAEPEKAYLSYAESYSLVEYLLNDYSGGKMLNLLTLFKRGSTYDEALTKAYGFDIDGLDTRWQESLLASIVVANEAKQSHPALAAGLSALTVSLALAGALEARDWRRSGKNS